VSPEYPDERKQMAIIALVANGSSRRVAARYIGCAPSTITRTAARDPEFAAALARAEQTAEVRLLRHVQSAAEMPKHWRAAAWLLERRNPEDFAARKPNLVTEQQITEIVVQIVEAMHEDLPEKNYRLVIEKLRKIIREFLTLHAPIVVGPADELDRMKSEIAAKTTAETQQAAQPTESADPADATRHPGVGCDLVAEVKSATGSASRTSDDVQEA